MTTLHHRRLQPESLNELITSAPESPTRLDDLARRNLSERFRAVAGTEHRRLDAWLVERAGRSGGPFVWRVSVAKRAVATAALRRWRHQGVALATAVRSEIEDQLLRAASGYARPDSLAAWLAASAPVVHGALEAEALNWALELRTVGDIITTPWRVAPSDAYYDVAGARTSLRARRDLLVGDGPAPVVVRVRPGAPGRSAGPGLRCELTTATLADPEGVAPARFIGVWPDAGVVLAVDATLDDLRAGARDLVRTAVAQRRAAPRQAA